MKKLALALLTLLVALNAGAVLNEKTLPQSLSVLRMELQQAYDKQTQSMQRVNQRNEQQHQRMLETMKKSNQISLMLYSQRQDYVFDLTYACHEATELYRQFRQRQMPYFKINEYLNTEITRYDLLINSLQILPPMQAEPMSLKGVKRPPRPMGPPPGQGRAQRQPPFMLDSSARADRDSCVKYATALRANLYTMRQYVARDSVSYDRMNTMLGSLDAYAKKRYSDIQRSIFQDTGTNYFAILRFLNLFLHQADQDIESKYSDKNDRTQRPVRSEWRGPVVLGYVSFVLFYLILAVGLGALIVHGFWRFVPRLAWIRNCEEQERARRLTKVKMLKPFVIISLASLLFAVSIMIVKSFLTHNFYLMASGLLVEYAWLLTAITVSLLIRLRYNQMRHGFGVFLPMTCMGLVIILFRIVFIPNNVVNLVFPPIALAFLIWQFIAFRRHTGKLKKSEVIDEETAPATGDEDDESADEKELDDQLKEREEAASRQSAATTRQLQALVTDDTIVAKALAALCHRHARKRQQAHDKVAEPLSDEDKLPAYDKAYALCSLLIILVATVLTWSGRTLMSVEIIIWWLFQLTAIEAITCVFRLLDIYEKARYYDRIMASGVKLQDIAAGLRRGDYITKTWFFDFVHMAVVPIASAYTLIFSIWMAADVFDLADTCITLFITPFLKVPGVITLSIFNIVVVSAAFFLFRYLNYAIKAFYRYFRVRQQKRKTGQAKLRTNEVNLTLGYNVIAILVWGVYIIFALIILHIPKSGISLVTAGLATGIGFALKDLINNFFYGISLMAGRLRVGDWIECDGVQGRVDSISYQSVQVITTDDCLMSFLNSTLFAKNFRNLTRNNSYELLKIPVGVAYGVNVEHVRQLLEHNIMQLQHNDRYGRPVIDTKGNHRVLVLFDSFGDNSVNLVVAMWVLVAEKVIFLGSAKEAVYRTLQENDIEIPFPQRDVHIKSVPTTTLSGKTTLPIT